CRRVLELRLFRPMCSQPWYLHQLHGHRCACCLFVERNGRGNSELHQRPAVVLPRFERRRARFRSCAVHPIATRRLTRSHGSGSWADGTRMHRPRLRSSRLRWAAASTLILVVLARASGAAAQCPPAGGTALPSGTGEDLEVTTPYTVCAGT